MSTAEAKAAKPKPIKLNLSPEDHRTVRVAAASVGETMAAFARRAVLERAKGVK